MNNILDKHIDNIFTGKASADAAKALAFDMLAAAIPEGHVTGDTLYDLKANDASREIINIARDMLRNYPEIDEALGRVNIVLTYARIELLRGLIPDRKSPTRTYILRNPESGLIKIGRSNDVPARVKQLQTGSGCELEIVSVFDMDIEEELHIRFAQYRVMGEWFGDPFDEIVGYKVDQE